MNWAGLQQTFESEGGFVGNSTIQMGTNAYTIEVIARRAFTALCVAVDACRKYWLLPVSL